MSRFIVTSGSDFRPFSYDELVKPVQASAEAHQAMQEQADALAMQAGAIGSMLDDSSPRFKALYDSYQENLKSFSDDLYENGLNPRNRAMFSALRKTYGTDITKINAAITQKAEAVKKYDEDIRKDRTLITDKDPRLLSLDEWYDNPYAGNYNAYSGTMLTAKASAIGENLKRDIRENSNAWKSILGGQYFERNEFVGFHGFEIKNAIDNILSGRESTDERTRLLESVMRNVYDSSGMGQWASPEQRAEAFSYIGDGIYSAIGENKNSIQQDRSYTSPYQWATLAARQAAAANRGSGSGASSQNVGPDIARLRGAALDGITTKREGKELGAKRDLLSALETLNELKKTDRLFVPGSRTMSDDASAALELIYGRKGMLGLRKSDTEKLFEQLTNGKSNYITTTDLDPVIEQLRGEINQSVKNAHQYDFYVKPQAASNMAKTFKLNIGELTGKDADSKAASIAKYSDGEKDVSAKDLMLALSSDHLSVGFDAKRGKITLQRNAEDDKESAGKYNDRIIYLDPNVVLSGTSAYVNAANVLYAIDSYLPPDLPITQKNGIENQIIASITNGETLDLRMFAEMLRGSYNSMVVDGDNVERAIYNALVESFARGLYYATNTEWSPNDYKEGWGQKTGGEYSEEELVDLFDEE